MTRTINNFAQAKCVTYAFAASQAKANVVWLKLEQVLRCHVKLEKTFRDAETSEQVLIF